MGVVSMAARAFIAGAAGTAGGLVLLVVVGSWAGRAVRRDLRARARKMTVRVANMTRTPTGPSR